MYIGLDIGGTKLLAAASSDGQQIDKSAKAPTPPDSENGFETILGLIAEVAGDHNITGIGIACPGAVDTARGIVVNPVNLPGWHGLDLGQRLRDRFNVEVAIDNDANSGALSEAHFGAGRGYNSVAYVTWSTGIGTGIVLDGKVYRGQFDTEGGHMILDPDGQVCACGGHGHWEALVAGPAIASKYGKPAYELTDTKAWDEIARTMAMGLANLIHLLSPDIVVLGGGVSTHADRFEPALTNHVHKLLSIYPAPPIVIAKHIEEAAVLGALILAKQASKA